MADELMNNQKLIEARDTNAGRMGSAYVEIDGERHFMGYLIGFEGDADIHTKDIPILGKVHDETKSTGLKQTWSCNMYYMTSLFRRKLIEYQNTGVVFYFDVVITNRDPDSRTGEQTTVYRDCMITKMKTGKLQITDDVIEEEMSGVYRKLSMPQEFTNTLE